MITIFQTALTARRIYKTAKLAAKIARRIAEKRAAAKDKMVYNPFKIDFTGGA